MQIWGSRLRIQSDRVALALKQTQSPGLLANLANLNLMVYPPLVCPQPYPKPHTH